MTSHSCERCSRWSPTIAADVHDAHGAARVLTNLGTYQDSKHLHIHVSCGEPLR